MAGQQIVAVIIERVYMHSKIVTGLDACKHLHCDACVLNSNLCINL